MARFAATVALVAWLGTASHADENPVGLYVGAGGGRAQVRVDERPGKIALGLKENHSAWLLLVGIRPLSFLGAEYAYLDFGQPTATFGTPGTISAVSARAQQRANGIFAVGYLPLPLPLLDLYGKGGIAHVQTSLNGSLPGVACVGSGCNTFHSSTADTSFAWGAGAQLKVPVTDLAVRAEYERFKTRNGDPDLVSVGIVWSL